MSLPIYNLSVLDNVPRAASGAQVYVYSQPTVGITAPTEDGHGVSTPGTWSSAATTLATIYSDNAGTIPLPNPFTLDGNANGWFYAAVGVYTVVITGSTLAQPLILVDQNLVISAAAGTVFQTNGTPNGNQALLNLVQGTNITLSATGGNVTITAAAAPVIFKIGGTLASSQVLQNLIAGSGISITDGGAGGITFNSTSGAVFQVNGTPTTSQSTINFQSGTNVTVTNPSAGVVNIAAAYPAFQVNGVPVSSATTLNFQSGTGITVTNPSAGVVNFASNVTAAIQSVTFLLSSAQLLALKTTPIQLLPAQGANTVIVPTGATFEFVPNTTPYATVSTADLAIYVDTTKATNFTGDSTGLIDQSVKTFEAVTPTANKIFTTDAHSDNQPLMIANVGAANFTAGDGTVNLTVNYYVVAVV